MIGIVVSCHPSRRAGIQPWNKSGVGNQEFGCQISVWHNEEAFIYSAFDCGYKNYFVYILASKKNGTLYVGVTSNLEKRVYEHKNSLVEGFTRRYGVHLLVYYEVFDSIESAIKREKQLKWWKRVWKINLIEESNSGWDDLYESLG